MALRLPLVLTLRLGALVASILLRLLRLRLVLALHLCLLRLFARRVVGSHGALRARNRTPASLARRRRLIVAPVAAAAALTLLGGRRGSRKNTE